MIDWQPERVASLPGLEAFAPLLKRLPVTRFPVVADLNAQVDARHAIVTAAGTRIALRFIDSPAQAGTGYEQHTYDSGEVALRPDNWHDLMNALAWLVYPQVKREINRLHCEMPGSAGANKRGVARDVLTLLDEDGVLVACADPDLAALLKDFRWKPLFWERRADVLAGMKFFVFGHALADKLRTPFRGLTAKALLFPVEAPLLLRPINEQLAQIDALATAWLRDPPSLDSTRNLSPLPVLGIPGWNPDSESADYYDDSAYFRPGRRMRA
jgi:hypothetical protein